MDSELTIELIKRALERPGKSKGGLAKFLGLPNSAITALLKGDRAIKLREVPKIRTYLELDAEGAFDDHPRPIDGILEIDVRAGLGAGGTTDGREVRHDGNHADPVKPESWHFPAQFMREEVRAPESQVIILETEGDSMSPTILSGDRVVVNTAHRVPSPDGIYAIRDRFGSIIVKRLQLLRSRGETPTIRIISDNKAHDPEDVSADEISIVGRVLWGLKRL